jgi:hypothetical protein
MLFVSNNLELTGTDLPYVEALEIGRHTMYRDRKVKVTCIEGANHLQRCQRAKLYLRVWLAALKYSESAGHEFNRQRARMSDTETVAFSISRCSCGRYSIVDALQSGARFGQEDLPCIRELYRPRTPPQQKEA